MEVDRSTGPPDAVLRAVAGELALLQGISQSLEDALLNTVGAASGDALDPAKRQVMQDFDLLAQSLDGLRIYLDQLAEAAMGKDALHVDNALNSVKLGAMRSRLSNLSGDPANDEPVEDVRGKLDLF